MLRRGPARTLLTAWLLILVVGSWTPFVPDPPRSIGNGLEIVGPGHWDLTTPGIAVGQVPPAWLLPALEDESLVIDVRLTSSAPEQTGPARIIALSDGDDPGRDIRRQSLVIGEEDDDLVVRARRPGADSLGEPSLVVGGVLRSDTPVRVTVVLTPDELRVDVDGSARRRLDLRAGWANTWDHTMVLSVGNTPSGTRPWLGRIDRATVATTAGTSWLLDDESLIVPERLTVIPPRLREARDRPAWREFTMAAVHVSAGFVLGALLLLGRERWVLRALLASSIVFVALNAGKVVMARRHPSVATLLLQLGGAGLGMAAVLVRRTKRMR